MMKIIGELKRNYKKINITILCICIYLICFPLIAILLEKISPSLTKCVYLELTGKPCPLCGGTRFLKNITNAFSDFSYLLNFFGILLFIIILEVIFRIANIFKKKISEKSIKIDIYLHIFLFICYTIYEIWFIINT